MIDMKVNYLGLELEHPLIVGAGPQADSLDGVRRAEDGGAAAIVFRSLFEEQLDTEATATFSAIMARNGCRVLNYPELLAFTFSAHCP